MRFRQSYAKTLWYGCPADLLWEIENERAVTKAMETGSLVDQMVFGGRNYHVINARVAIKKEKGQPQRYKEATDLRGTEAKEQAEAARARGQIPCFQHEAEAAERTAGLVRAELNLMGIDLSSPDVFCQRELEWSSPGGFPCRGTPDVFFVRDGRAYTVDLKIGQQAAPDDLERLVWSMCWDVQGATYQEGVCAVMGCKPGEHWLVRGTTKGAKVVTKCPLDDEFMEMGRDRLDWCRNVFRWCVEHDEWPEYDARPLVPQAWMKGIVERRLSERGIRE